MQLSPNTQFTSETTSNTLTIPSPFKSPVPHSSLEARGGKTTKSIHAASEPEVTAWSLMNSHSKLWVPADIG